MAFPVTLNGRTYTLTDFEGTNYVDGLPDAFEDFVTQAGQIYSTTSTTSNSIGTGSKTFTVEASKPYQVGTPLRIADTAAVSTNWIDGIVTAYSGTTLTVNAVAYAGSGTKTAWSINIGGGPIAYTGTLPIAQGGTGATTAAAARTNIDVYSKSESESRYLNISGDSADISFGANMSFGDNNKAIFGAGSDLSIFHNGSTSLIQESGTGGLTLRSNLLTVQNAAGTETVAQFVEDGFVKLFHDSSQVFTTISGGATITGSLGIGTSSPASKMTIASDVNTDTRTFLVDNAHSGGSMYNAFGVYVGGTDRMVTLSADYGDSIMAFRTNGSEAMRITSEGRIGAGTAAPAYQLHLNKGTNDDGLFIGSTSNTENKRIVFGTAGSIGKAAIATRNIATFGRKHLDFHINIAADNTTDIDYSSNPCLALMDGNRMAMNSQTETSVSYTHRFYINDDRTGSTSAPLGLRFGSTATRRQINFMNPNGIVGRIQTSGTATSYVTSSDYRLKENVVDITDGIERVKQLSPKRFNFIADADLTVDGFIAHETQTVVPEAIDGVKDETHAVGNVIDAAGEIVETGIAEPEDLQEGHTWTATGSEPVYQGIDQSKIVPVLTAALKEAIAKIEALETRLTALEG